MEKLEQLVKLLGIDPALVTEEADIKAIAEEFKSKQIESLKDSPEIQDAIKEKAQLAKEEGEKVGSKLARKALNNKFGLSLTNSQVEGMKFDEVAELAVAKIQSTSNADVDKLNERIIELTKEVDSKDELIEKAKAETREVYEGKWKNEKITQAFSEAIMDWDGILTKPKALKQLRFEAVEEGYTYEVDDEGNVSLMKDGKKAMRPDGKEHETIKSFADRALDEYKKRSNGSGEGTAFTTDPKNDDKIAPEIKQRMNEMLKKQGILT